MGTRPPSTGHHVCVPREGEPSFVMLGRDPHAYQAVEVWANLREQAIADGLYPASDKAKVAEAREQAAIMREYQMALNQRRRPPPKD